MSDVERIELVGACKWVDEVAVLPDYKIDCDVRSTACAPQAAALGRDGWCDGLVPRLQVLDSNGCHFVVHGDDLPMRTDGTGVYDEVRRPARLSWPRAHSRCDLCAGKETDDARELPCARLSSVADFG